MRRMRWTIHHGNHAVDALSWDEAECTVVKVSCPGCGYLDVRHVVRPEDTKIIMERAMQRFLELPWACSEARRMLEVRKVLRA